MSFISLEDAQGMVNNYETARPEMLAEGFSTNTLPLNITFSKDDVLRLLNQEGADKLRVYFGMDSADMIDVILVAANSNNEDIIPDQNYLLLDRGVRCPENCPPASSINS